MMASQAWPSWPAPQLVAAAAAKAFISCSASAGRLQFINFERNYFITTAPVPGDGTRAGAGAGAEVVAGIEAETIGPLGSLVAYN